MSQIWKCDCVLWYRGYQVFFIQVRSQDHSWETFTSETPISMHDWGFFVEKYSFAIGHCSRFSFYIEKGRFVSGIKFFTLFCSAHYNVILWKLSHKPTTNILINSKLTCLPIKSRLLLGFGPRQLFGSLAQSCYSKCLLAKYQQIRVKTPRKMKATLSGTKHILTVRRQMSLAVGIFVSVCFYVSLNAIALLPVCLCVSMSLCVWLCFCLCALCECVCVIVLVFALLCLCAYNCVFVCVFQCLCVCDCVFVCVPVCACDRKVAQETYDGWKGGRCRWHTL